MRNDGTILLLDSILNIEDLKLLKKLDWIPESYNVETAKFEITDFWNTFGFDIEKARDDILASGKPVFLFSKAYFIESIYEDSDLVVISSAKWPEKYSRHSHKIIFLLFILKWICRDISTCSEKGCINAISINELNPLTFHLCRKCQEELAHSDKNSLLHLAHLIKKLINEPTHVVEQCLSQPLGYSLCRFNINSNVPSASVKITEKIIDYHSKKGSQTRDWLYKTAKDVIKNKSTIKSKYVKFTSKKKTVPILIAARRWNSWTPATPTGLEVEKEAVSSKSDILNRKTGGGYFLSDGKTNIVIDPGYGFLELIHTHDLSVCDIDSIIITHDHPDHSAELANILTMRFIYEKECKPLSIFLNPSSHFIYRNLLKYYKRLLSSESPVKIRAGDKYLIGGLEVHAIAMLHEEIIDKCADEIKKEVGQSNALGLKIKGESKHIASGKFNIAIVGDTSFPSDVELRKKIKDFYGKPDIAAIHVGSIEEKWKNKSGLSSKIEYGKNKHLGINGCAKLISLIAPRLTVVTEFGEELDAKRYRLTISDIIRKFSENVKTVVLPSDVDMSIAMKDDRIFCKCQNSKCSNKYVPIDIIQVLENNGYLKYSYEAGCETDLDHYEMP